MALGLLVRAPQSHVWRLPAHMRTWQRLTIVFIGLAFAASPRISAAASDCKNGVVEGGEECDPGGPTYKDSPSGQACDTTADCSDGGTCVSGHCRCASNSECTNTCATGPDGFGHCTCKTGDTCFFANSGGCCKFNCQSVGSGLACDDGDPCSIGERCNQVGVCKCAGGCDPAGGVGLVCHPSTGECDPAEVCQPGIGCPADVKAAAGTRCTDDGNVCTVDECNGISAQCQHTPGNAGTVCRPSAGECDPAETCTGRSATCPPQSNPDGTPCTDDGNVCTDDTCDATGTCIHSNNTSPCPDDGNPCTTDQCSGGACTHAAGNAGAVCRAAVGACDLPEHCTGSSPDCPADAKSTAVCRPATDVCDIGESCDGISDDCPPDTFQAAGVECRASAGVCDPAEKCTGSDARCPADAKSTAVCRPAASGCDVAERCDGVHNQCPVDTFQPANTMCDFAGNACQQGTCDAGGNCLFGFNQPPGTNCDDNIFCNGTDICDDRGTCRHSGNPCPGTQCNTCQEDTDTCFDPAGTMCDDGDSCTIEASCDGVGDCVGVPPPVGSFAILRWPAAPPVPVPVVLGRGVGTSKGSDAVLSLENSVCADTVQMRAYTAIHGDLVASATSGEAVTLRPGVRVTGDVATGGGTVSEANATVNVGGQVDITGSAPQLARCAAAACWVERKYAEFAALPVMPGFQLAAIELGRGAVKEVDLASGQVVLDVPRIQLGGSAKLLLVGDTSTQLIVRTERLKVGTAAHIEAPGMAPEQIVFMVTGSTKVGGYGARVSGSILTTGTVRVGRGGNVDGGIFASGAVRVTAYANVNPHPFVGW